MDKKVVTDIINQLEDECGKTTVTTGQLYPYCGMVLKYEDDTVKIDMSDYIKGTIKDFPEDCTKPVNTPATTHQFEVNEQQTKLDQDKAKLFHTYVVKLLFVSKRGMPDIQVAIAFLSTRIIVPDVDDWKNLLRLMMYLNATKDLLLTLSIESFHSAKWWVDASYATHPYCKGHTGGTMSLGKGSVYITSCKQKINARSL